MNPCVARKMPMGWLVASVIVVTGVGCGGFTPSHKRGGLPRDSVEKVKTNEPASPNAPVNPGPITDEGGDVDSNKEASSNGVGRYRSLEDLQGYLVARVIEPSPNGANGIYQYIYPGMVFTNQPSLVDLLPGYWGNGLTFEFRNGQPNALNYLLWDTIMTGLSTSIYRGSCDRGTVEFYVAKPSLDGLVKKLCSWPNASALDNDNLRSIWLAVMGYRAPASEMEAWLKFVTSDVMVAGTVDEAIPLVLQTILLNPYFLLEH